MRHQRTIRFSEKIENAIDTEARQRGFASPTAFVRYAVEQELSGRQEGLTGAEERLAGSIEQARRDLFRVMRVQQALFAYIDTLAKTILTCLPEPPVDAKSQAVARAKERYDRLLKSAGRAMVGESKVAMQDLVGHVEGGRVPETRTVGFNAAEAQLTPKGLLFEAWRNTSIRTG